MNEFPRIRDLPENERKPFNDFLRGQTRPWIDGEDENNQDAYYPWDYKEWKRPADQRGLWD